MNLSVTNIIKRIVLFVVLTHINQYCLAPRSSNSFFKKAKDFVIPSKDKSKAGNIVGVSATVLAIIGTYMLGNKVITWYKSTNQDNKNKDQKGKDKGAHAENVIVEALAPESVKFPIFYNVTDEATDKSPTIERMIKELENEINTEDQAKWNKNLVKKINTRRS